MGSQGKWDETSVQFFILLIMFGIAGIVCIFSGLAALAFGFGLNAGICGGIMMTRDVPSPAEDAEEHF